MKRTIKIMITAIFVFALTAVLGISVFAMQISVRNDRGNQVEREVDPCDTIESLKQTIRLFAGQTPDQQRLVFAGQELRDDRTFSDYDIKEGSIITLISRNQFYETIDYRDSNMFPDENFRKYVSLFDTNNDGMLSKEERENVVRIDLRDSGTPVADCTGIGHFPNLKNLLFNTYNPWYYPPVKLDVRFNLALEELVCPLDLSEPLDVSNNTRLRTLVVSVPSDTIDLSTNTALEILGIRSDSMKTLDLSSNQKLRLLSVSDCLLTELDISACPLLKDAVRNGEYDISETSVFINGSDAQLSYQAGLTILTDSIVAAYDANGGSGFMPNKLTRPGDSLTLPECRIISPTGKQFAGWQINDGIYQPGNTISPTENITIIAQWEDIPVQDPDDTPPDPDVDGLCEWCGKPHTGFFGKIVGFFHSIFNFFVRLFG